MTTYSRKPDIVDAWQFTSNATYPSWVQSKINSSEIWFNYDNTECYVFNPEGQQTAFLNDYVLKDTVTGVMSACPSSAFSAKWQAVP